MFDDFQRPDGLVIGSTAPIGGVWAANPTSLPGLHIVSKQVVSPLNQESVAAILAAMSSPQFAGDWWCRFRGLVPSSIGINVAGCWLGDDQAGPYCGLAIQSTGVGLVNVTAGNIGDGDFGAGPVTVDTSEPTEYVFQFLAAGGGTVKLLVNDDELVAVSPYVLDPATPLDFATGIIQSPSPGVCVINEVELSTGVYVP